MEKRKVTGVLINTWASEASKATLEDNLDAYYKALDCTCIDITYRTIGGKMFCIICDDEGLLKPLQIISAVCKDNVTPALVGNLFIVSADTDDDGNFLSLPDDDINLVLRNCDECGIVRLDE